MILNESQLDHMDRIVYYTVVSVTAECHLGVIGTTIYIVQNNSNFTLSALSRSLKLFWRKT